MMNRVTCCVAALALVVSAGAGSAATVLAYDTAGGTALSASETGAGVTGGLLTAGPGVTAVPSATTFNFRNWDPTFTSGAQAIAGDEVWSWGFSSTDAYNLTDMTLRLDRSGSGPQNFLIEAAVNGSMSFSTVFSSVLSTSTATTFVIDLSGLTHVTEAIFNLAAFGSSSNSGTFDLEGFDGDTGLRLTGNAVAAVPLPAGLPLIGAGLIGLWGLRRVRKT
jgi:hypothetical protein